MQCSLSAIALLAFAGRALAVIPACATSCIADAVAAATSCGATDLKCQCTDANKASIQAAATSCVIAACGAQAISEFPIPHRTPKSHRTASDEISQA